MKCRYFRSLPCILLGFDVEAFCIIPVIAACSKIPWQPGMGEERVSQNCRKYSRNDP